jgi:hypothetical protein
MTFAYDACCIFSKFSKLGMLTMDVSISTMWPKVVLYGLRMILSKRNVVPSFSIKVCCLDVAMELVLL